MLAPYDKESQMKAWRGINAGTKIKTALWFAWKYHRKWVIGAAIALVSYVAFATFTIVTITGRL